MKKIEQSLFTALTVEESATVKGGDGIGSDGSNLTATISDDGSFIVIYTAAGYIAFNPLNPASLVRQ